MISSKGAIMSLLMDAYRMRDSVAMVMFRKNQAEVLLPPTNSISVASRLLETLPEHSMPGDGHPGPGHNHAIDNPVEK